MVDLTQDGALLRLTYSSRLVAQDCQEAFELIRKITDHANTKNVELHIGGELIFNEDTFEIVQVLEGNAVTVNDLFALITRDDRHTTVIVTEETAVASREYPEWGMMWCRNPKNIRRGRDRYGGVHDEKGSHDEVPACKSSA
mmetsp:Transcript_74764/g.124686  ORF Transcript_74764/g.124686 Transcript_74764/m.124686 type:complete len:142 (+) Transcript_74764:55-480(+)